MKYFILAIVIIFTVSGCGLFKKKEEKPKALPQANIPSGAIKKFNNGLAYLDNEDYEAAKGVFSQLIIEHPTSEFHLVSLYNLAASYEGMGQCKQAGKSYRKVARAAVNKYPRLEAQALFRLSFAYACVGSDSKAIFSLIDAKKRRRYLQDEVAMAEIPARLAAAYARMGQREKAEQYFSDAKRGIQFLRAKHKKQRNLNDILAKTLFLMGRISPVQSRLAKDSKEYLKGVQFLQSYLLESMEMNSPMWSPKAYAQMEMAYNGVWELVDGIQASDGSEDPKINERITSREKYDLVSEAIVGLKLLKKSIVLEQRNPWLMKTNKYIEDKQLQFEGYLSKNAEDIPLTDSAKKREGLKRGGRTIGPSQLERKSRNQKLPDKRQTP